MPGITLRLHAPQVKRASARRGGRDPHLTCARDAERTIVESDSPSPCQLFSGGELESLAWTGARGSLGWPISTSPARGPLSKWPSMAASATGIRAHRKRPSARRRASVHGDVQEGRNTSLSAARTSDARKERAVLLTLSVLWPQIRHLPQDCELSEVIGVVAQGDKRTPNDRLVVGKPDRRKDVDAGIGQQPIHP